MWKIPATIRQLTDGSPDGKGGWRTLQLSALPPRALSPPQTLQAPLPASCRQCCRSAPLELVLLVVDALLHILADDPILGKVTPVHRRPDSCGLLWQQGGWKAQFTTLGFTAARPQSYLVPPSPTPPFLPGAGAPSLLGGRGWGVWGGTSTHGGCLITQLRAVCKARGSASAASGRRLSDRAHPHHTEQATWADHNPFSSG